MFKSFQEYIDQNKKLVEKPKVAKIADFEGKQPRKPEKESLKKTNCGCSSGGKGQVGEASPYSNGENAKDPNKDDKAGLVYKGDQKLVYEPDVDEKSKETKTWPKTGMSEWLKDTRNLSIAEFTRRLKEENGNCCEGVQDAAKKLVEACKCNKKNLLTLVREARRGKILQGLMKEVFNTPESFEILSKLIESKKYSNKFDKMFSEMVAEPMGMDGGSMGEEGEEDHEGMEDDDMDMDMDMGDEEGHDDDHEEDEEGDEGDEDEEDHDDMEDMEDEEDHDDMDMEDEEDHDDMDMGDEEDHERAGMGMGMNMGPNSNENPFLPKEATWHPRMMKSMQSIDAPESARERLTSMREPFSDEEKKTNGGAYSQLKIQLMDAKKRVKEIEAKMVTLVQMGRADDVYESMFSGTKHPRSSGYTDGPEGQKKRMHELTKVRELESELRTAKQRVKELESEMDKFLKSIGKK